MDNIQNFSNSIENNIVAFQNAGIKLKSQFSLEQLFAEYPRAVIEKYALKDLFLFVVMQDTVNKRYCCSNMAWFDAECIEDNGDYKSIAEQMIRITEGDLKVQDVEDCVDLENDVAWLSFMHNGIEYRKDLEVNDDWYDPVVFEHFINILEQTSPEKMFIYITSEGQDFVIGCVKKSEYCSIKKLIPKTYALKEAMD